MLKTFPRAFQRMSKGPPLVVWSNIRLGAGIGDSCIPANGDAGR
jgi:hypothetical protein